MGAQVHDELAGVVADLELTLLVRVDLQILLEAAVVRSGVVTQVTLVWHHAYMVKLSFWLKHLLQNSFWCGLFPVWI